eukprot:364262-Chlamydomonas_euryale.AAC.15
MHTQHPPGCTQMCQDASADLHKMHPSTVQGTAPNVGGGCVGFNSRLRKDLQGNLLNVCYRLHGQNQKGATAGSGPFITPRLLANRTRLHLSGPARGGSIAATRKVAAAGLAWSGRTDHASLVVRPPRRSHFPSYRHVTYGHSHGTTTATTSINRMNRHLNGCRSVTPGWGNAWSDVADDAIWPHASG